MKKHVSDSELEGLLVSIVSISV